MKTRFALSVFALMIFASKGISQDTGDLKITFKLKGDIPAPQPIKITQDQAFCGKYPLKDESLVVNKDNKGVANIFVWVYTGRGGTKLDEFPASDAKLTLANKDCRFEPHAMIAQVGDTVNVTNPDEVAHNANLQFFNDPQNFLIPAGQEKSFTVKSAEPTVAEVACNIHPWMKAKVLLLDHPFGGISNADGRSDH